MQTFDNFLANVVKGSIIIVLELKYVQNGSNLIRKSLLI